MGVRLYDYMAPGVTPGAAFAAAVVDIARRTSGEELLMPDETVEVTETLVVPATVAIHIPRGGQISASGTLTLRGRITSEAATPFSGTVRAG